jgi:hypothetical protein
MKRYSPVVVDAILSDAELADGTVVIGFDPDPAGRWLRVEDVEQQLFVHAPDTQGLGCCCSWDNVDEYTTLRAEVLLALDSFFLGCGGSAPEPEAGQTRADFMEQDRDRARDAFYRQQEELGEHLDKLLGLLRCEVTNHPCGTDTVQQPCDCPCCTTWEDMR